MGLFRIRRGAMWQAESLRCADGRAHHGCLSDAQVHTLETFATEERTAMPLSNGVDSVPGYNVLAGASLTPFGGAAALSDEESGGGAE